MRIGIRLVAVAGLSVIAAIGIARAADHRDGAISQDQPADIADTYAFVNPNDTSKVVLIMTVNPFAVPGVNSSFSTDVLYQFKIDNDGDFEEDLVVQAVYEGFDPSQQVTVLGPAKPSKVGNVTKVLKTKGKKGAPSFTGASNATVLDASAAVPGMRVFSGRTDDPFFTDLIYVRSLLGVIPPLERQPGLDLFAGLNVSSLAVELPISAVKGDGDVIRVWSTASRSKATKRSPKKDDKSAAVWVQVDREGLPAINATLIAPASRDQYNKNTPDEDGQYVAPVAAAIQGLGALDATASQALADFLFPDVLTLDTTSVGGFPNGRAPADDVVDTILSLLTDGGVSSDGVDANDSTGDGIDGETGFPTTFPFLAPEHAPSEPIPARD